MHLLHGAREVGVNLKVVYVADDKKRRVLQRLAILEELLVCFRQVPLLALVLPREVLALPHIGEATPTGDLRGVLFKGIPSTGRIRRVRSWTAQESADVNEVLLCRCPL